MCDTNNLFRGSARFQEAEQPCRHFLGRKLTQLRECREEAVRVVIHRFICKVVKTSVVKTREGEGEREGGGEGEGKLVSVRVRVRERASVTVIAREIEQASML